MGSRTVVGGGFWGVAFSIDREVNKVVGETKLNGLYPAGAGSGILPVAKPAQQWRNPRAPDIRDDSLDMVPQTSFHHSLLARAYSRRRGIEGGVAHAPTQLLYRSKRREPSRN
jgi:hypothetical protein